MRAQLELVRNGSVPNPGAVLQDAANTIKASVELLLTKAAAIPIAFPRELVNSAITDLTAVADAIAAAPGKALHALTDFAGDVANTFALPVGLEALAVVALAAGGFMAVTEKKVTPLSRNLLLVGAGAGVAAGFVGTKNVLDLVNRKAPT